MAAKLIFLAGSARKDSCNKKLARAAEAIAKDKGAQTTFIDLIDYDMPLLNEDWEAENGRPQAATELRNIFAEHDGFFLSSPEYNSSITPLIKNTFDWMTRTNSKDEDGLIAFRGKVCALGAASPGGLGGMRVLIPTRLWLSNISIHVIPSQFSLGGAFGAFDEDGTLKDEKQRGMLEGVIDQFISTAATLNADKKKLAA